MSYKGYYPAIKKPQGLAATKPQGNTVTHDKGKDNILADSKARYEKGKELYSQGRVSIGKDGFFRVNGFVVDVERVRCECPDYTTRKQPCKHYYAASLFARYGGKGRVADMEGSENGKGTKVVLNPKPIGHILEPWY